MKKTVINATEGGARIKGTTLLSLKDALNKYCTEPIDKSELASKLTLADNGDVLVEKVIPLLKQDIVNLDEIILHSRRGLASCRGMRVLMSQPSYRNLLSKKKEKLFLDLLKQARDETGNVFIDSNKLFYQKIIDTLKKSKLRNIIILSAKNFEESEAAHVASTKNPLVNVAIYGASRAIQGRELKKKEGLAHFLKNNNDALIRVKRNALILQTAKTAATSLKKSYEETLDLLIQYYQTKDNSLLTSTIPEIVNFDDAESYFEIGNWAHPLLDAEKIIGETHDESVDAVYQKAIRMRDDAIILAKKEELENADKRKKLIEYNSLMEESRRLGREEKNFEKALQFLKQASELMPDSTEAKWGIATALHHNEQFEEALRVYEELIETNPENHRFRFEYGQVLLRNHELEEGLKQIELAMEKSDEFDSFLSRVGEIYEFIKMPAEALKAYTKYLKKYPSNFEVWIRKGNCLTQLGRTKQAEIAYRQAKMINPYHPSAKAR
jgi:tetratricopeptide (TPR) repeat protein